ncbi:MAG: motility associated factor glycosyltransferase family protein, partial [Alkalispirochaeta sp.]
MTRPDGTGIPEVLSMIPPDRPDLARDTSAILTDSEAPVISPEEWEIIPSKEGSPTLRLAGRYVHSRFDPVAEGEKRFQRFDAPGIPVFVGLGLGYLLEAFRSARLTSAVVIVFSPEELRVALRERPAAWWNRFGPDRIVPAWIPGVIPTVLADEGIHDPVPVVLEGITARCPEAAQTVLETIEGYRKRSEVNRNTLRRFGKLWVRNGIRNLVCSGAVPGIDALEGIAEGVPAVICGAGPTIDDLEPVIRDLARSHLLIAVDTAVPVFHRWGISPHFAVVSDPQYWNTRHLDAVTFRDTVLVAEPATHPRSLRLWNGPLLVSASLFPLGTFFDQRFNRNLRLGAGGSVATSGWDLARVLGSREIALAGIDLGFPRLHTHCGDSFFERRLIGRASRLAPAEHGMSRYLHGAGARPVPAAGGGEVLSDRRMEVYRSWFAEQARRHPEIRTVLFSPESSAIAGIAVETPASRRQRFPEIPGRLERIREVARSVAAAATVPESGGVAFGPAAATLSDLRDAFAVINDLVNRGIAACRYLATVPHPDISILDAIDAELLRSQSGNLAGFLAADEVALEARNTVVDHEGAIAQAAEIYTLIGRSCEYHLRIIDRALLKLRRRRTDNIVK